MSDFRLHYKENEMDTVEKTWDQKQNYYRYKCQVPPKSAKVSSKAINNNRSTRNKIRHDFSTSISTMPGSTLGKVKGEQRHDYEKPARRAVFNNIQVFPKNQTKKSHQ